MVESGSKSGSGSQVARWIFLGVLLLSIGLTYAAWSGGNLGRTAFLGLMGVSWSAVLCYLYRAKRGGSTHAFLSLALLYGMLVVPELGLRVGDFHHETGIEFGYPRPRQFLAMQTDNRLFWRMMPGRTGINSLGFPGREIGEKREGVLRVVVLGDSCTFQTKGDGTSQKTGYVRTAEDLINAGRPDNEPAVECIRLAVPGYTSHQGRVLTELYGEELDPDVVIVYFGWNDHWRAYGSNDRDKVIPKTSSSGKFNRFYRSSRLLQFLSKTFAKPAVLLDERRVSLDHYLENLTAIARSFRSRDVPVVFITAPTSHRNLGVPDYLTEMNFVSNREMAVELHTDYTNVVREVAAAEGSLLLDLEQEFNTMTEERMREVFLEDGIHFTAPGIDAMAERLSEYIAEEFLQD